MSPAGSRTTIVGRFHPRRLRSLLLGLGLLTLLGLAGCSPSILRTSSDVQAQGSLPPGVLALLPPGSQITTVKTVGLTGSDGLDWAVLYQTPRQSGFGGDMAVAIVTSDQSGYTLVRTIAPEFAAAGFLSIEDVAGTPAVVFFAVVGAHGAQMTIVRWDGTAFVTVFEDGSDTPGYEVVDVDGDGIPEVVARYSPYCQSYASSPQYVIAYKWNGVQFAEWSGPYPDSVIGEPLDDARSAIDRAADWSSGDRACLLGNYAFLLRHAGEAGEAARACAQARATDLAYQSLLFCPDDVFSPTESVRVFYQLLDAHRLIDAWDLLSEGFQAQQGDERAWAAGYQTLRAVTVDGAVLLRDSPPLVKVSFTATDTIDGQLVMRSFSGTWQLVLERGIWKLDTARIQ